MTQFNKFSTAVRARFDELAKTELFKMEVSKDDVWDKYLSSFPDGTNEIYLERPEHDCNFCRIFIKRIGNVVAIVNGELQTVWDVEAEHPYDVVAKELSEFVKASFIKTVFRHNEAKVSVPHNIQILDDKTTIKWDHFSCIVPNKFVTTTVAEKLSSIESAVNVFKRGLNELSVGAFEIVNDLIEQNSLYRGEEFKDSVQSFLLLKKAYDILTTDKGKNIFVWMNYKDRNVRFKNSVIGTLVVDISEGMDLDVAVNKFESKVAPTNYKRPSSVITKSMVESAMKTIKDLDLEDSLNRRFAIIEDISINNVVFADKKTSPLMKNELTDMLMSQTLNKSKKSYDKVGEVTIEEFVSDILPQIDSMSVLMKNQNTKNLVSLIAPKNDQDKRIFKWDNNFSWSYNGNITDSIKEKVKRAGGSVDGVLRVSLNWFNTDDLDIHVTEPSGRHIFYGEKCGILDVDMNVTGSNLVRDAVENLNWNRLENGIYKIGVHNYYKRESIDVGFVIEVEYNNEIKTYSYDKMLNGGSIKSIIDIKVDSGKISINKIHADIGSDEKSKNVWNVETETFQKVNMMLLSPNYWDEQKANGNKHYFFMLENCVNPEKPRGIYNEFLINDLTKHRKVFEILGDKTKCELSNDQLSGLGFSSTKNDEVMAKVDGNFSRTLKIKF